MNVNLKISLALVYLMLVSLIVACTTNHENQHKIKYQLRFSSNWKKTKNVQVTIDTLYINLNKVQNDFQTFHLQDTILISSCRLSHLSYGRQLRLNLDSHLVKFETLIPIFPVPLFEFNLFDGKSVYSDIIEVDSLERITYRTENLKKIELNHIQIETKNEDIRNSSYFNLNRNYKRRYNHKAYDFQTKFDSTSNYLDKFSDYVNDHLIKSNFSDSINSLLVDNENEINLSGIINKLDIDKVGISALVPVNNGSSFINCFLSVKWIFTDKFKDTLFVSNEVVESDKFNNYNSRFSENIVSAISNALIKSINRVLAKPETQLVLKKSEGKIVDSLIIIPKPNSISINLDNSIASTVIIKSKDRKKHGSGFFISNDGHILTNYHVINNSEMEVLFDGKDYNFKILRTDKVNDLALIKIEAKPNYCYAVPTKKNFTVGTDVFAIGTPKSIELGQSVSKGIISAFRKAGNRNVIQSDVVINGGNSGGPLVNNKGELIGVAEYKIIGNTEGIGFGIPAFEILDALSLKIE